MSKNSVKSFAVGDRVKWKSQASGHWKEKTGTIIEVVPPHTGPQTMKPGVGYNRKHESYVVAVEQKPHPSRKRGRVTVLRTKKPEHYWPVVANLRLVKRGNAATVEPVVDDSIASGEREEAAATFPDEVSKPIEALQGVDDDVLGGITITSIHPGVSLEKIPSLNNAGSN